MKLACMQVTLGIGCDRGTPQHTLERAAIQALTLAGAAPADVRAAASIDLKVDEAGLLALAARYGWPLHFYPAARLAEVGVPNPSEIVRRHTGTPSVSEAAALVAAHAPMSALLVEKHKVRGADGRHATVSVARCLSAAPAKNHDPATSPPGNSE